MVRYRVIGNASVNFGLGDVSVNFKKKFSMAAESLAAVCMAAILVAACGGGSAGPVPVYIASAGVGEVLQFSVDGGNMIYSYAVVETSYAASGVTPGKTSSGTLLALNADGSYNLGPSLDGFIQGGKLFPVLGQLAGHVNMATFPGAPIPVFGIVNPITTPITINGVYDYQGFSCNAAGIANATGVSGCASQYGTMTIAAINPTSINQTSASYTTCDGGDITSQSIHGCVSLSSGTMESTGTPGVYNMFDSSSHHVGWFFASYAPNGQIVGVIDHDDQYTPAYGHSVLTSYAGLVLGTGDGSYYVNDNEGKENRVSIFTTAAYNYPLMTQIIYTTNYTSTANPGAQGTLTLNTPWNGMSTYYIPASGVIPAASGVAMVSATGAYTHTSLQDAALFATGAK
jgi:hypothetical protein